MKRVIIIAKKSSPILLSCIPDNHNDDAEGEKLRNEIKWEEKKVRSEKKNTTIS